MSDALTDTPPTETAPERTDEDAQAADRYVRKYGGDPNDPTATKRALAKALSDDTRLSSITREKEQQDAVIAELRSRVAAVEHLRDDYVPPPAEVDPGDDRQVNVVVEKLLSQNPEAQSIYEEWRSERIAANTIYERDAKGNVLGGELATVLNDLAGIDAHLDTARRDRLGLTPLADIEREDLQMRQSKLEDKRERLVTRYQRHLDRMREIQGRNNQLRELVRERVVAKAEDARQKAAEREQQPQLEAEAEQQWDEAFEEARAGLPAETADLLEEHLLFRADNIVNGQGRSLGNMRGWMEKQTESFLRSIGITQGRGDVAHARAKDSDRRSIAPIGRASIAVPDRSEKTTPGDRLRAAERRTSVLSRRITAR